MAIQAAGSFGALGGDLSGINQFFQRQAQERMQSQALQAQAQQQAQAQASAQALAAMQNSTAQRGQDIQRELGLGSQGIDLQRLGQQGSQFGQSLGLDRDRLNQQGSQFDKIQASKLDELTKRLGLSTQQFSDRLNFDKVKQAWDIEIGGKRFNVDKAVADATIAYQNAQTADIPKMRANDTIRTGNQTREVTSNIKYRDDSIQNTKDELAFRKARHEYETGKDKSTFLTTVAQLLSPDDPQKANFLNQALSTILGSQASGGGGGYQGGPPLALPQGGQGTPAPSLSADTKFAGGSNARMQPLGDIAGLKNILDGVNDPEQRRAILDYAGGSLGLPELVKNALMNAPSAGGVERLGGDSFTEKDSKTLQELRKTDQSNEVNQLRTIAMEHAAQLSREAGNEKVVAELRELVAELGALPPETDFRYTWGTMRGGTGDRASKGNMNGRGIFFDKPSGMSDQKYKSLVQKISKINEDAGNELFDDVWGLLGS